ncbi:Riboflavin kinase [Colletotrichum sp. SAR 10_86]|nr:Riboflavin kinase [Colletotrichum sp. SAR 10_86]KAI8261727.1 Riboflavin kinase [Colletotrichum sp. SAR 10_77]
MSVRCSTLSPHKPTLTEENLPDQAGKVFLITGASGGIGTELVKILYSKNAKIWLAARSYSKTQAVINEIKVAHPTSIGEMVFLKLQLHDLSTIKESAQQFLSRESRLDVLWNNAGVMVPPQGSTTVQGHELQLGINNLGHQLFTQLLTPLLERTSQIAPHDSVRVIWVSSSAADGAPRPAIDFSNMDYHKEEGIWSKYSRSKAGNVIQAAEYARRMKGSGVLSLSLNPGNFVTNLQQNMPKMQLAMFKLISHPPKNGAYTELFAGLDQSITSEDNGSWDSQTQEKTFWQTALDETKYFAGGLISHPFEYTKHYAILRHSTVLVWYRGPSTSVTVTIFSDAPLPPTRTVWLQRKGFSGNMGMNLKSLVGANDSWLDVTPSSQALPTDMAEGDERGCQRDIKKFLKKAPKNLSKHMPRETHVIRIPAAADDGYFRLVLCTGGGDNGSSKRKVLCPSPVFRIASTSTDASVVRGASFASMPLELGIKAGSIVANTVVNRYVGPAAAVVQSRTKKLQTAKFVTKHATHIAYGKSAIEKSGIKTTVTEYETQYATTRGGGYAPWQDGESGFDEAPPEVIGPDSGPMDPFPIKFDGRIVRGTGRGGMELGIPTANLSGIPEDVKMRMRGVYFGWARVVPRSGLEHISTDWHESIITVGPAPYATPRVAAENVATVHIIHEFGGALFLETKLKVLVMGQLRVSTPPVGSDAALQAYGTDVLLSVASLSRDNWCPIETRERMRTMRSEMSLADRYVETREKVQKQVDRIPVHLAGVRTEGAALRDKAFGNGGIWIPR